MKKLIAITALAGALLIPAATSATAAEASSRCSGYTSTTNRAGYLITFSSYRASGMKCSSVRYAVGQVRRKMQSQSGYPRVPGYFWDGYVRWDCDTISARRVRCDEYTTHTSFTFTGTVY